MVYVPAAHFVQEEAGSVEGVKRQTGMRTWMISLIHVDIYLYLCMHLY